MIKKIIYFLSVIVILTAFSPLLSLAQDLPDLPGGNFLNMTMSPENPEPGQLVKIALTSYSYDLDRSKITWYVDGQAKKTEMGLKEFNTSAGKNGQKTIVKAVVETPQDGTKEIEAYFIPSLVDLIFESLSYTPPFYKGKALNPNQGVVLVVAMPELVKSTGEKIPAQNVIYSWKKDGTVQGSVSGLGKNTFMLVGSVPIRDVVVEVTASSLDGNTYASKQINITNVAPKILFYEDSPIYGLMFNKAINGTVRMLADEFKVRAFPLFMSVGYAQSPDLNYKWNINNRLSENLDIDKTAMIFRQESKGAGTANIDLKIENTNRIFQFGNNGFVINFEKQ